MTGKYMTCRESFLWRMKYKRSTYKQADEDEAVDEEALEEIKRREGEIEIFQYTGENDLCQFLAHDRIAVGGGGGFGFIVQDNLSIGTSSPSKTYGNPSLVSSRDGRFEVANMEASC